MNSFNTFISFPLGTKEQMSPKLDELFMKGKYHPVDDKDKPFLAIPLVKKEHKVSKHQGQFLYKTNGCMYTMC